MADIMYYDIATDESIVLTQERFDDLMKFLFEIGKQSIRMEENGQVPQRDFSFKLAVYPNRTRSDGVFVAEDRPIEPYKGIRNLDGGLCYPSVPQHGYVIPGQLPHDFAFELIRRWNEAK